MSGRNLHIIPSPGIADGVLNEVKVRAAARFYPQEHDGNNLGIP
jgi:hypothetical protein